MRMKGKGSGGGVGRGGEEWEIQGTLLGTGKAFYELGCRVAKSKITSTK